MTKIFKSISIFVRIDEYFRNQLIDKLEKIFDIVNARIRMYVDADLVECVCVCLCIEIALKLWYLPVYYGPHLFIYCVITFFSTTTTSSSPSFLLSLLGFDVFAAHRFGIWTKLILACYSFKTAKRSCQNVQKSERDSSMRRGENMQVESERI